MTSRVVVEGATGQHLSSVCLLFINELSEVETAVTGRDEEGEPEDRRNSSDG
jgi:hypothetical protein